MKTQFKAYLFMHLIWNIKMKDSHFNFPRYSCVVLHVDNVQNGSYCSFLILIQWPLATNLQKKQLFRYKSEAGHYL